MFDRSDYSLVSAPVLNALDCWACFAIVPGSFTQAALRNDFVDAVLRADPFTVVSLRNVVGYMVNELPGKCFGSEALVKAWAEDRKTREKFRSEHPLFRSPKYDSWQTGGSDA